MHHLIATLSTLGFAVRERAEAALGEDRDRGATTIEIVFWSAALLALAGLVYAAIQAYVTSKIPEIS